MTKKPTQDQIDRAAKKVLAAAKRYGDRAAVEDYTDDEQAALLGAGFKYAELFREAKAP